MAVQITIDQLGKPAGVAGKAREDLDVGTDITLTSSGGPFSQYLWSIISKPPSEDMSAVSNAALSAPSASTTILTPIDQQGTYHVELVVDSGSGLGANANDTARITFYAGDVLSSDPAELPRRKIAFQETTEHNVNDVLTPLGNPQGWAREMQRYFRVYDRMYNSKIWAWGNIDNSGAASIATSTAGRPHAFNVASVNRTGLGTVEVNLVRPMLEVDSFWPQVWLLGTRGFVSAAPVTTTQIVVETRTVADALADRAFGFAIHQNIYTVIK